MLSTRGAVCSAITLRCCGRGGRFEERHDVRGRIGRQFGGGSHPAREIGFERFLVSIACSDGVDVFAGLFVHYTIFEEYVGVVENAGKALLPGSGAIGLEKR